MPLSNRLFNPTPFDESIPWHKGIVIKIKSGQSVDLEVDQMDDFRPGKPGSEEALNLLVGKGLFLRDTDVDYDIQALDALQQCHKAKNDQFKERVRSYRSDRAAAGIKEDIEVEEENLRTLGLAQLEERIKKIAEHVTFYKKIVEAKKEEVSRTGQMNPELTLFMVDGPPREFPSKAAKALFKQEKAELVAGDPAAEEVSDDTRSTE